MAFFKFHRVDEKEITFLIIRAYKMDWFEPWAGARGILSSEYAGMTPCRNGRWVNAKAASVPLKPW